MWRIPDRVAGTAVGLSASASVLVAYSLTLAPGVVWSGAGIDSGDFAAAVAVGGVPHPTGYPTLMLLGLAVRAIPLGDLALRLNVLTALAAAGSLIPLGLLAARLRPRSGMPISLPEAASAAAVLAIYGLAPLVWSNAIVTEVYALASLLLWSAVYAAVRARTNTFGGCAATLWAFASGMLIGLGTGAHITVALGAPALTAILLQGRWGSRSGRRPAAVAAAGLVAGCSVFAYLPVAASLDPPINWGNPANLERFWSVVSGEIYRSRLGGGDVGTTAAKAAWLLGEPARQLTWVLLPLLAVGGASLTRRHGWATLATGWIAMSALAVSTLYNSRDDEVFILPALAVFALWSATGVSEAGRWVSLRRSSARRLLATTLPALLITAAVIRGTDLTPEVSMRDATHAAAFAHAALAQADPNTVIVSDDDRATFPLWYASHAPGGRSDVTIVDQRLWQFAWYRESLNRQAAIPMDATPATMLDTGNWPRDRPLWAVDIDVSGDRSSDVRATVRTLNSP